VVLLSVTAAARRDAWLASPLCHAKAEERSQANCSAASCAAAVDATSTRCSLKKEFNIHEKEMEKEDEAIEEREDKRGGIYVSGNATRVSWPGDASRCTDS